MEKKRQNRQKIWTAIGVALAIVLLLFWLTMAIWVDDEPEAAATHPTEQPAKKLTQVKITSSRNLFHTSFVLLSKAAPTEPLTPTERSVAPGWERQEVGFRRV